MSDNRSILLWICSLLAASLTSGSILFADDNSTLPSTEKVVPVKSGSPTGSLKVKDPDPYKNLHVPPPDPNKYDPTKYSLNQTSSMANKGFSAQTMAISKNGNSFSHDPAVSPKPYDQLNSANLRNGNGRFATSSSNDASHTDSQFSKNYSTANATMGANHTADFTTASNDQNRTATLGGQKSDVYSSGLSKQYLGPGAQHVPDGLVKENVVISHVSDLPNRPLTIDEVRGLINHGFKPDTTVNPDAPTKAINDPDYKPEASPEPPEMPVPRMPTSDDDPLPTPGAMSQPPPENSDPLPQH